MSEIHKHLQKPTKTHQHILTFYLRKKNKRIRPEAPYLSEIHTIQVKITKSNFANFNPWPHPYIYIWEDNQGAIALANSKKFQRRTKHIDLRYHFLQEYVEKGVITVVFVRSAENRADIHTKNTGGDIFNKHVGNFLSQIHSNRVVTPL